jgi:hypothetical protein
LGADGCNFVVFNLVQRHKSGSPGWLSLPVSAYVWRQSFAGRQRAYADNEPAQ